MAHIRIILFTFLSFTMIGNVQAGNTPLYLDLGIIQYDNTGLDSDLNGSALGLGVDLGNYFALEGLFANSDEYQSSSTTISSFKIDYVAAGLLRFNLRYDNLTLYLFGGYSRFKVTASAGGSGTVSGNSSTEVYGAGMDIYGTKQTAVTVRWYKFGDDTNLDESDAVSIGLHFYFDVPRIHKRY